MEGENTAFKSCIFLPFYFRETVLERNCNDPILLNSYIFCCFVGIWGGRVGIVVKSEEEENIYIKPFCTGLFILKENISFKKKKIFFLFIWLLWVLVADHPTDALL